jgi:hypothetical protein
VVVDSKLSAGGRWMLVPGHRLAGDDPHVRPPGACRLPTELASVGSLGSGLVSISGDWCSD